MRFGQRKPTVSDTVRTRACVSDSKYFLELSELKTVFLFLQVKILQATGLPQHLSHFVFCKYNFWDQQEPVIVAPEVDTSSSPVSKEPQCMVVFDQCNVSVFSRLGQRLITQVKTKNNPYFVE